MTHQDQTPNPEDQNNDDAENGTVNAGEHSLTEDQQALLLSLEDTIDFLEKRDAQMSKQSGADRDNQTGQIAASKKSVENKLRQDFLMAVKTLEDEVEHASSLTLDENNGALNSLVEGISMIHKGAMQAAGVESLDGIEAASKQDDNDPQKEVGDKAAAAGKASGNGKKRRRGGLLAGVKATADINPFKAVDSVLERGVNAMKQAEEHSEDAPEFADCQERLSTIMASIEKKKADYDRAQATQASELDKASKYGAEKLAKKFIEVVDNVDRALQVTESSVENIADDENIARLHEGLSETRSALIEAFAKNSITREDPMGQKLDPHSHQAVQAMPKEGASKDEIIGVMAAGYRLHEDRIIRPAMVIVAQ